MASRRDKIILGLDTGPYMRGLAKASTATKAFVKDLDSTDSRMGNLVQTSLALGPALVPIGAVAVPAVASLTASLGAAAGAAGVAALAFQGIGDGLGALNDYQLEPTAENLEKVKQAFEDLGPAGSNFVLFLDKIEPKLNKLQNTAREGVLPGVQEGIEHLLDRGPQANRIIGEIADTLGDLAAEGGEGLAGPKFRDFFDYIEREARPILTDMGRTAGNVAEGLANMLVGFGPASSDFSNILLDLSRDFAEWSRNLDNNQGFQEFLDYVRRVSPKALDTLGSVAVALGDIVEAAAPVGEATLPIIKAVAETLSAIAESPAGPTLIAAAAGISAVSRGVALFNAANASSMIGLLRGAKEDGKKAGAAFRGAAAGVGLFALSMTDVDENVGLSNTAMGAMLGTLGGPWGIAIGTAIGGAIDFANRNDDVAASLDAVNRASRNPTDLVTWGDTIEKALSKTKKALDDATDVDDFGSFTSPAEAWGFGVETLTGDLQESADKARKAQREFQNVRQTLGEIRAYVKDPDGGFEHLTGDVETLTRFAKRATPALRSMGLTVEDLKNAGPTEIRRISAGIRHFNRESDSLPGRAQDVRDAIRQLDNPMIRASDAADDLEGALSALFDPQLNAREALIEWKGGLVELRKQIKGTNGSLNLNTKAGRANQSMIIDSIRDLKEVATTQAEVDGNSKRATKTLKAGRKAIIQAGVESGISAKDMRRLVNQMGLVPELVKTNVKTPGAKDAKDDLKAVDGWARTIPGKLDIFTDAPGAEPTKKDLEAIKDRQDKVDRQLDINTDAPGADKVRGQLQGVDRDIRGIDGKNVKITLTAAAKNVLNAADKVWDTLGLADGGTVDYYANGDVRNGHTAQIAPAGAWRVWAEPETGGEAYIPLAPQKRERSLDIWQETGRRLGVDGFADGGLTLDTRVNGHPRKDAREIDSMFGRLAQSLEKGYSKAFSDMFESMQVGFHWPLPKRFGPSGNWGSYASGGDHPALDWPAPLGTPIFATLPGRVSDVQHLSTSYGNHVRIRHGNGLESISAHMERTAATEGEKVLPGSTIGYVDSTGNSTGNHLHLEFRRNGVPINYTSWLHGGGPMGLAGPVGVYDGNHAGLDRGSPAEAKGYAKSIMGRWGWGPFQWPYWEDLGNRESGWRWNATNPSSGAYGIPQSLPPGKMASAGADWRTNVGTQLDWMAGYMKERYGGPYGAIQWHNAHNWYGDGGIRNGGINVFDNGGIWKHGQLGVNLSGRDEYVNDPQATAAAIHMANGGLIDGLSGADGDDAKRLIEAFSMLVKWTRRNPEGFDFPDYLGLNDKQQNRLNRAGQRFDIREGMDPARARQEITDLIDAAREAFGNSNKGLIKQLKRFRERVGDVSKSLEREQRERQKLAERLKATRQRANEFSSSVTGNFRNDLFSGGLDQFLLQGRADRNDARSMKRALNRASRKGLDGGLFRQLAASGNLELAQQFARADRSEIRRYERLFAQRQRSSAQLGDRAATIAFGHKLDRQTRAVERQTEVVERWQVRRERLDDRLVNKIGESTRKGVREGFKDRNKRLHQFTKEARG